MFVGEYAAVGEDCGAGGRILELSESVWAGAGAL